MIQCFFLCKLETAYEIHISDLISDVCSSDLHMLSECRFCTPVCLGPLCDDAGELYTLVFCETARSLPTHTHHTATLSVAAHTKVKIGRESGRERECQCV